jgi:hypothetical protein
MQALLYKYNRYIDSDTDKSLRFRNTATVAVRVARGIVAASARIKSTTVIQLMSWVQRKEQHTLKGF